MLSSSGLRSGLPPREVFGGPLIEVKLVGICDLCGETDGHTRVASGYDYELETCSNQWHFVKCSQCGHVWLNPRPAPEALSVIYPRHYYAYQYDQQVGAIARRGKALLDRLKLSGILRHLGRDPDGYLDVGCGNGRFLSAMARRGVPKERIYGLELDQKIVASLAEQGYQTSSQRIEDCDSIPDASLDLITMFHVIEHVEAPVDTIQRLADWLRPGGILALETPNLDSLDARLFKSSFWGGYHIPRHWHLFTPDTLVRALSQAGLEVLSIQYQPGHSFWLYSIHHSLKYGRRPFPRLARFFDPFKGLLPLMVATGFDLIRSRLGFRTSAMLVLARKPHNYAR
jgi:2-polyprenyl-3-methyl-5-hydroxy-6-metoxy-1,4-benzoquinol methylase